MFVFLFLGLFFVVVLVINKLVGMMGVLMSIIWFVKFGKVDFCVVGKWFFFVFIGFLGGLIIVYFLFFVFLKFVILIFFVLVVIYIIFKKNWGIMFMYKLLFIKKFIFFIVFIFIIGFYDGFLGVGIGLFILFVFLFMGFDFL